MTIQDYINTNFESKHIEETFGDTSKSIDLGFEIRKQTIKTGKKIQAIEIHPNEKWTDGTVRPEWFYGFATIYLNKTY